jgi:hypothetical protein
VRALEEVGKIGRELRSWHCPSAGTAGSKKAGVVHLLAGKR